MMGKIVYILSNSSTQIYPKNTRSKFSNILEKPVTVSEPGSNALWVSLESAVIENSIIQYKTDMYPDIILDSSDHDTLPDTIRLDADDDDIDDNTKRFIMPDIYFDDQKLFVDFLRIKTVGEFFKDVYLENGHVVLHILKGQTFISQRLYRFLGFNPGSLTPAFVLTVVDQLQNNVKKYYKLFQNSVLKAQATFDMSLYIPDVMKILTTNIEPYLCGGDYKNILCTLPLEKLQHTTIYTPQTQKKIKINTNILNNISVELVDEKDNPILFTAGPPNIIKLRVLEMSRENNSFYIQVSNTDSIKTYVNNSLSLFRSKLPKELNLNGEWEAALANIFPPTKILNISSSMNSLEIEAYSSPGYINNNTNVQKYYASIPPCYCSSLTDLILVINDALKDTPISFSDREDGKLLIIGDSWGETLFNIKVHKKLAGLLGYSENKLSDVHDNTNFSIIKLLILKNSDTFEYTNTPNPDYRLRPTYWFINKPNFNFSIPPWVFLYCSIVSPTIIGHASIPLLKIIPLTHNKSHQNTGSFQEFQTLEYYPLKSNYIHTLQFELRTHDGELLEFKEGDVQLTLSFRKNLV